MLSRLPLSALEAITFYLDAQEIGKLVLCGNTALNTKLRNGGVRELHLKWPHSSWIPWISGLLRLFPRLISLSVSSSLGDLICPRMELGPWASNLRSLSLDFQDLFVQMQLQDTCLSTLVPSLTSLQLASMCFRRQNQVRRYLAKGLFPRLPPSLQHLAISARNLDSKKPVCFHVSLLQHLPPTLLTLDLGFALMDDGRHHQFTLPPHLEVLRVCSVSLASPTTHVFMKLPPTLRQLSLPSSWLNDNWTGPPSIVVVNRSDTLPYTIWPPHLTDLEMKSLEPADIRSLPPTLTRLTITGYELQYDELVPLLPPSNITHLSCRGVIKSLETLPKLPPGLISTVPLKLDSPTSHNLNELIPNVVKLEIFGQWDDVDATGFVLPSRLTSLVLHSINDSVCLALPKTLQYLESQDGLVSEVGAAAIPKGLIQLAFLGSVVLVDDNVLRHWGHIKIVTMCIVQPPQSKLSFKCFEQVTVVGEGWTDLRVRFRTGKLPLFGANFMHLTNLVRLSIGSGVDSPPGMFLADLHFPPSLRYLYINRLSAMPTADELKRLPPMLQELHLWWGRGQESDETWGKDEICALPRSLRYLSTQSPIEDGLSCFLPPYLYISKRFRGFVVPIYEHYYWDENNEPYPSTAPLQIPELFESSVYQ